MVVCALILTVPTILQLANPNNSPLIIERPANVTDDSHELVSKTRSRFGTFDKLGAMFADDDVDEDVVMLAARAELGFALADIRRSCGDFERLSVIADLTPDQRLKRAYAELYTSDLDAASARFESLSDDPNLGKAAQIGLAEVSLRRGEVASALQQLDAVLERQPKNVAALRLQAMCFAKLGRCTDAIRCLRMLSLSRRGTRPHSTYRLGDLAESAITHGRLQVAALCRDRPEVAKVVIDGTPLHDWLVCGFGGCGKNGVIAWDSSEVPYGLPAMHRLAADGNTYSIMVSRDWTILGKTIPASCDEILSSVVFEIMNIENVQVFQYLRGLARHRLISREEFSWEFARAEYSASIRTVEFLVDVYWPVVAGSHESVDLSSWRIDVGVTFEDEMREHWSNRNGYPWVLYGLQFDDLGQEESRDK